MRQQRLRRYLARLKALQRQRPRYDTLLTKLGAAQALAGRAASLITLRLPPAPDKQTRKQRTDFDFELDRAKLRTVRKREGRYLLRSNLTATDPAQLWQFYLQLVEVEAAFKNLKSELSIRPIFHQREDRIEAHILCARQLLPALPYLLHPCSRSSPTRARHAQSPTQAARTGAHTTASTRQTRRHPAAGCALSDHRWTGIDLHPLYRARSGPTTRPGATELEVAGTSSAAHYREQHAGDEK